MFRSRKGVELSELAFLVIALVAVALVINLFADTFPKFSTNMYCSLYQAVNAVTFMVHKPSLPAQCSFEPTTEKKQLGLMPSEKLADELSNYVIGCWKKSQEGKTGSTFICFELYIQVQEPVIEEMIAYRLSKKGYCDSLSDNFLEIENRTYLCGDANKLVWNINVNETGTYVIKYDAFKREIAVS